MIRNQISRRTALRGVGCTLSLPFLEAMLPREARASTTDAPITTPARSVFIHVNSGVANEAWYPTEAGRKFALSRSLSPLEPVREDVCVITGLGHASQGHLSTKAYLTGRDVRSADTPIHSVSIDQAMAELTGEHTRHPSLNLDTKCSLSYNRSGTNLPSLTLTDAFNKLFVQDTAESKARQEYLLQRKKSMLDGLREQVKGLSKRLGRQDQRRMTEYLDSVRDLEKEVARAEAWMDRPKPEIAENEEPENFYDLIYLALRTDSTRVLTWFNQVGYSHDDTHHFGKNPRLSNLERRDLRHMQMLSDFLQRLKDTEEAEGSMLDHTMVLFGSSLNNGDGLLNGRGIHAGTNLATMLCGGRALGIDQGQHLLFEGDSRPPLCNVFATMLEKMGGNDPDFGRATGPLRGLSVS